MSRKHFQSIQEMIKELEGFGYRDITDEVKPYYTRYLYLCTLERPEAERDQGSIYCETVNDLLTILEQVKPSLRHMQAWFCVRCRAVGSVRYRRGRIMEAIELIEKSHREQSSTCPYRVENLRILNFLNLTVISSRDVLYADETIPIWAKDRLVQLLFEEEPDRVL